MKHFEKVFVYYPRGVRTGGPEALHQLVHSLRRVGVDAFLVPQPGSERAERVSAYSGYDAPEAAAVSDIASNAVIASEHEIHLLASVASAVTFCWWLSIDNSPVFRIRKKRQEPWESNAVRRRALGRLRVRRAVRVLTGRGRAEKTALIRSQHLTQSMYAWTEIYSLTGRRPSMLSDYLPARCLERKNPESGMQRGAVIAFNPKKVPGHIIGELRAALPDYSFVALQGMSPDEVQQTLCDSRFYLDLGYHPGKDRMPREAAAAGCWVVVAARGSGAFFMDVPLPAEFKVDADPGELVGAAARVVRNLERIGDAASASLEMYVHQIRAQEERFEREVEAIFVRGLRGFDVLDSA